MQNAGTIPDSAYLKYQNLIRSRAWYYAQVYKVDFHELESLGNEIFCDAWRSFNPELGFAFSTHLTSSLQALGNWCQKQLVRRDGHSAEALDTLAQPFEATDVAGAESERQTLEDARKKITNPDSLVLLQAILEGQLTRPELRTWKNPNIQRAREHFATWGKRRVDGAWYELQAWWRDYWRANSAGFSVLEYNKPKTTKTWE